MRFKEKLSMDCGIVIQYCAVQPLILHCFDTDSVILVNCFWGLHYIRCSKVFNREMWFRKKIMCNEGKMGYNMYSRYLLKLNLKVYTTDFKIVAKGNSCLLCLYSVGPRCFLWRCQDADFISFVWNTLTGNLIFKSCHIHLLSKMWWLTVWK